MRLMWSTRSKLPGLKATIAAWLSLAALLLPAMARSDTSPLSFPLTGLNGQQIDQQAVFIAVDRERSNAIRLAGFDLADTKPSTATAQRQVRVQGGRLVATGQALDVGALPSHIEQRLDNVWQVIVGAAVNPHELRIRSDIVENGSEKLVASIKPFRHGMRFDTQRNVYVIDGGVVLKLRTDRIETAGNFQLPIMLTTENY